MLSGLTSKEHIINAYGEDGKNAHCIHFFYEQGDFFDEYRIEGKDESNEIYLEVINENLVRAMKSAQNAQSVKIKLTKKQSPCLTFEVTLVSEDTFTVSLSLSLSRSIDRKKRLHVISKLFISNNSKRQSTP